jgi:hypothetical protein
MPAALTLLATSKVGIAVGTAILGFVVGMYTVETTWIRRHPDAPVPQS